MKGHREKTNTTAGAAMGPALAAAKELDSRRTALSLAQQKAAQVTTLLLNHSYKPWIG
jgi:hypothetical protein